LLQAAASKFVGLDTTGEPIATRWTAAHKAEIKRSRVAATRAVVDAVNALPAAQRPRVLVSTSAIGELLFACCFVRYRIAYLPTAKHPEHAEHASILLSTRQRLLCWPRLNPLAATPALMLIAVNSCEQQRHHLSVQLQYI
jgi:hypothetical protein